MKHQFKSSQFIKRNIISEEAQRSQAEQNPLAEQDTTILPTPPQPTKNPIVEQNTTTLPTPPQSIKNPIVEQDTTILSTPSSEQGATFSFFAKVSSRLPRPLQRSLIALIDRARDPQAEVYSASRPKEFGVWSTDWGWFPLVFLINAIGIALVAYAFAISRDGGTTMRAFLYPGLILIYTPTALRLLAPSASRNERIALISTVAIFYFIFKVMISPLYFSSYDEFLHWRTINDIVDSGHLFSLNPILPVSSYYPGLEIVTDTFSTLSGLDTFHSGLVVIGITHLLTVMGIFALNEHVFKSARLASIAAILYIANSQFLLFDAQFAYESLALPLAILILLALAIIVIYQKDSVSDSPLVMATKAGFRQLKGKPLWILLAVCIMLIALALTHHVTDFLLAGLLILWAVIYGVSRVPYRYRLSIACVALFATCIAIIYILSPGNPVGKYLSSFIGKAASEFSGLLTGIGSKRKLFSSNASTPTPVFEQLLALSCVGLVTLGLLFGWLCIWKRYRLNSLICTFGIASSFYPIFQALRFTNSGEGLVDRSTSFLFIPITCVLAVFIVQFWPTRRLSKKQYTFLASVMTIMLLGGMVLAVGAGMYRLPGTYVPTADVRGVDQERMQAAIWADSHLGPKNRIGADSTNVLLMGTYGDQDTVTLSSSGIDVSPIFFSLTFGPPEISLLRHAQIHYLAVDLQLAHSLPISGFYFVQAEYDAYKHTKPIPLQALTKFNTISRINKVLDSGDIVIYDTEEIIYEQPETP